MKKRKSEIGSHDMEAVDTFAASATRLVSFSNNYYPEQFISHRYLDCQLQRRSTELHGAWQTDRKRQGKSVPLK